MEKKQWVIQFLSLPRVFRYCKKCGGKAAFICTERFRVNAQRKYLDIWLIYQCADCGTTWNAAVFSRVSPQRLDAELLDGFYQNDAALVKQYAMDIDFLRKNGAEAEVPRYAVAGDVFSPDRPAELEIKSEYSLPVKVSSLIRDKLRISRREYSQWIADGRIKSVPDQDLRTGKVKKGILLVFNGNREAGPAQ